MAGGAVLRVMLHFRRSATVATNQFNEESLPLLSRSCRRTMTKPRSGRASGATGALSGQRPFPYDALHGNERVLACLRMQRWNSVSGLRLQSTSKLVQLIRAKLSSPHGEVGL